MTPALAGLLQAAACRGVFPSWNDDSNNLPNRNIYSFSYIVPSVHGRSALQQEVDGGDGGEVTDGVAANTGGVPWAG